VSKRAALARINRKLAERDEKLVGLRGQAAKQYGSWVMVPVSAAPYTSDVSFSCIQQEDVDLEKLGRELGVLRPYEALEGGAS